MILHLIVANFAADFGRKFGPLDIGDVINRCVGADVCTLRSMPPPTGSNGFVIAIYATKLGIDFAVLLE